MSRPRRAFVIHIGLSVATTGLQFVTTISLARLVTPASFGAFAVALALVNLAHVGREWGVAAYIQQAPELEDETLRGAHGLLLLVSGLLAAALIGLGTPLADWTGEAEAGHALRVMAIGLVLAPGSVITSARLQRELAAGAIARVSLIGSAACAVVGIGLAQWGWGAMALAWAQVANVAACAVALAWVGPSLRPGRPTLHGWDRLLRFGFGPMAANLMSALNQALPSLWMSRLDTPHHVGLLVRAQSTVGLFSAITGAAVQFGALAEMARAHHLRAELDRHLQRSVERLTGAGWPMLAVTAVLGQEFVLVLFGPAWLDCVEALPTLACLAALGLLFQHTAQALTAVGRPALAALPITATVAARLALILPLFSTGPRQMATLLLLASLLVLPMHLALHRSYLGVGVIALGRSVWRSAALAIASASAAALTLRAFTSDSPVGWRLGLALAASLASWTLLAQALRHPLMADFRSTFASALSPRAAASR